MVKYLFTGFLALIAIFIIDQNIKQIFIDGYRYYSGCIDLILTYNRGVAFSMFAFLQEYLKYLQIALIAAILVYVIKTKPVAYAVPIGMFLGAGISNIYDRFIHGGVVDYVAWHCGFNFAVFNFADVIIDLAVVWILLQAYLASKKEKNEAKAS